MLSAIPVLDNLQCSRSEGEGASSGQQAIGLQERATIFIFQRSDPNVVPPKGSEANLTLGGIDLNSSGSVVVKADKKLLTVLFPDGRDGRAFTFEVLFMLFPATLVFMSFTIPLS
ncbi:hypothetical protein POM88_048110 [Heracleum sosnowskyi]|uniref:Uncharacterized protein n=1 Tax=Heracleum sosnowskyi TaxID=360622 RepID=A0AAD8GV55_9APIA|nr:hypothetical protein POM88_048110 [Heracleum sosnowskyi]